VVFADPPIDEPPTAAVTAPDTCFRQIEFAGILKGAKNRDLAEKWIDFMLSLRYQEDLPLNQFVYPVHPKAKLPEVFVKHSTVAEQPAALAPEDIAANRGRWVEEWTARTGTMNPQLLSLIVAVGIGFVAFMIVRAVFKAISLRRRC